MALQIKMCTLVILMFGILYGVIAEVGTWLGEGSVTFYVILAILFMGLQYLIGPYLVEKVMCVRYVSEEEEPELHRIVDELARNANIPKPKVGISQISIPNAFAFGKSLRDGRVCVSEGILKLLNKDELKAVLGHEISHIKNHDMMIITLLSVIPLILYWISRTFIWGGVGERSNEEEKENGSSAVLIGLVAMMAYIFTQLLVLVASRIREYYADEGSVKLGNSPHYLVSALYKLVCASAYANKTTEGKEELRRVAAIRAFFLNDVQKSLKEVTELTQIDTDLSGTIDKCELESLKRKDIKISFAEKLMEIFTTHPNTLKRIKRVSTLI